MVFSSMVFLWIFLPITIVAYYTMPGKCKNILLLLASLIFYAWGEPIYVLLMLLSIFVNWLFGIGIGALEGKRGGQKVLLVLDILFNLSLLGYYKYFNFVAESFNRVFKTSIGSREIALPIGISFFTFQILSYIIDLYRGQYKAQKNIINLALYISFFPQLIAGPIVKYKDINEQLSNRVHSPEKTALGMRRFIYGLGKKVIIANVLAKAVDTIYGLDINDLTGTFAWAAAIMYTLQIYFDFSGYSDMAIGLGKIFGFDFQENFLYPYVSSSIQEFWRRWHVSLSTWFKEYVYIPLGGNRKGTVRTYVNLFIVFFITGLWHGAGWTFVLWGLYHGFFSIIERLGLNKFLQKHNLLGHLYTLIVVNFGWVLFRAENFRQAGWFVKRMLLPWRYTTTTVLWQEFIPASTVTVLAFAVMGCGLIQQLTNKSEVIGKLKYTWVEMIWCAGIFILCVAMLASSSYNPFIYFRF